MADDIRSALGCSGRDIAADRTRRPSSRASGARIVKTNAPHTREISPIFTEIAMRHMLACSCLLLLAPIAAAEAPAAPAPILFFDVAGPESARLGEFYSKLFGWVAGADGNWSVPVGSPVGSPLGGALRAGDPTEHRIYIGVADVAAKLAEVAANGGTVDAPRFAVPGVVILGLFKDPAGNPMGLVETEDGKAKIP
jgi:uncharacterized protein